MTSTTKLILPVALIAALLGGSVGAFVMRPSKTAEAASTTTATPVTAGTNLGTNGEEDLTEAQASFRDGFLEGYAASKQTGTSQVTYRAANTGTRRVYRSGNSRRVYYDYSQPQPRGRSFWQKHRDKLTVAMGAGGGALLGALIGGKKGAGIGALAGGGGSALYTYKLRKRNRNY
jgi:hypothetical protein